MSEPLENWAGNVHFAAARVHRPTTVDQIQAIVRESNKVKAIGTRHSFNSIGDTKGDLICLDGLNNVLQLNEKKPTVTVEPGITYGALSTYLLERGFAVRNLASLPHISVGGSCATATHGSGVKNGNLSTYVSALDLVLADGSLLSLSREADGERFLGAVVGLGALGVVVRLTLDIVPAFEVSQTVYENVPGEVLDESFEALLSSGYSVSFFTNWASRFINQVWVKANSSAPVENSVLNRIPEATKKLHPLPGCDPINCTEQLGVFGPSHERLPHFRMDFTPSSGEELQTEYFVALRDAPAAMDSVLSLRDKIRPLLQISEIRSVAADNLWMSMCYERDSVGIHFTWRNDWEGVRMLLPEIDNLFAKFDGRPHWGKLFETRASRLQSVYRRFEEFKQLAPNLDPAGKFRNSFLDRCFNQG